MHVSRNTLQNIQVLGNFQNLVIIDASNNKISEVALKLPKLESLNLMNNSLQTFPQLQSMKRLKYLNLSNNRIQDLEDATPEMIPNLERLEIEGNALSYASSQEFQDGFISKLAGFDELKILNVAQNPFAARFEYKARLALLMRNLRQLDGQDAAQLRKTGAEVIDDDDG